MGVERSLTIRLLLASDQFDAAMLAKGIQVKVLAAELGKVGKDSGGKAGGDFGGAFTSAAQAKIADALAKLPKAKLDADSTDADRRIATLRKNLETLQKTVGVHLSDEAAVNAINHVRAELDKLQHADNSISIRVNAGAASAELDALQVQLASLSGDAANVRGGGGGGNSNLSLPSLGVTAVLAGLPLVGPLAGAATSALGEFAGVAGVAKLAVSGLNTEMDHQSSLGLALTGRLGGLKSEVAGLEATAAGAASGGVLAGLDQVDKFLPTLNPEVAELAGHLGAAFSVATGGVLSALKTASPLLSDAGKDAEFLAHKLADAGRSPEFEQLIGYGRQELPIVVHTVVDLATALGHVIVAAAPIGSVLLAGLDGVSTVLSHIPIHVLTALAEGATLAYVTFKGMQIIESVNVMLTNYAAKSLVAAGASEELAAANASASMGAGTMAARFGALGLGLGVGVAALIGWNEAAGHFEAQAASGQKAAATLLDIARSGQITQTQMQALGAGSGHWFAPLEQNTHNLHSALENAFNESNWTKIKDFDPSLPIIGRISVPFTSATKASQNFFKSYDAGLDQMVTSGNKLGASDAFGKLAKQAAAQGVSVDQLLSKMPKYKADLDAINSSYGDSGAAAQAAAGSYAAVDSALSLGSGTAQKYSAMVGITADEVGKGTISQQRLNAAVAVVAGAYDRASASQGEYLAAVQAFGNSEGTAADRAALIGAALKAANGDALGYAGAMSVAYVANQQFVTDFDQARTAAKAAHREFDGVTAGVVNLANGTINYRNAAAGPLISDLQSMQDAAMKAAQATYQHGAATDKAKASSDAYNVYVAQTRDALIGEAKQLGLTKDQAGKLADQYFGMPKDVKTQIEAIGTDPVVQILDRIGGLLANLTHQPWQFQLTADDEASVVVGRLQQRLAILNGTTAVVHVATTTAGGAAFGGQQVLDQGTPPSYGSGGRTPARAAGGGLPEGRSTINEQGFEVVEKHGANVQVYSHQQSMAMLPGGPSVPAFAAGTSPYAPVGVTVPVPKVTKAKGAKAGLSAKARAAIQSQVVSIQFKVENSDLDRLHTAITGSAGAIRSAMATLIADVHNAALKGLGSESVIPSLRRGAAELEAYANRKAAVAKQLKAADAQLVAQEKLYADEQKTAAAAVLGTFDAGTAGNGTYGSLMGVLESKVTQAERFHADLKSLTGRLDKATLAQIESEGPDQAGANLHALAGASPQQIAAYEAQYSKLRSLSQQVGTASADSLYKAGVDAAKGLVRGLESQESAITKAMSKIAASLLAQIKHDLKINSPSRETADLFAYAGEGGVRGLLSKEADVRAAGTRLARAAVVSPGELAFAHPVPHTPAAGVGIDYERLARALAEEINAIPVAGEIHADGLSVKVSRKTARGVR